MTEPLDVQTRELQARGFDRAGRPTYVDGTRITGRPIGLYAPDGTKVGHLSPGGAIHWRGHHSPPTSNEQDRLCAAQDTLSRKRSVLITYLDGQPVRATVPGRPPDDALDLLTRKRPTQPLRLDDQDPAFNPHEVHHSAGGYVHAVNGRPPRGRPPDAA